MYRCIYVCIYIYIYPSSPASRRGRRLRARVALFSIVVHVVLSCVVFVLRCVGLGWVGLGCVVLHHIRLAKGRVTIAERKKGDSQGSKIDKAVDMRQEKRPLLALGCCSMVKVTHSGFLHYTVLVSLKFFAAYFKPNDT